MQTRFAPARPGAGMIAAFALLLIAAAQAQPPRPLEPGQWVTMDDYPHAALRYDMEGAVTVRLDVDRHGRVTNCSVTQSSGAEPLDRGTCDLLRERARFAPARNAAGAPASGAHTQVITWALPPARRIPIASWSQVSRATISGAGAIAGCTTHDFGPVPPENGDFCQLDLPPRIAVLMRGGPDGPPAVTIIEANMAVDGMATYPRVERQGGRRLVSLISSRFEINEEGRVENCRIVEREGDPRLHAQICTNMFDGPFVPDRDQAGAARRRSATVVTAFWIEPPAGN